MNVPFKHQHGDVSLLQVAEPPTNRYDYTLPLLIFARRYLFNHKFEIEHFMDYCKTFCFGCCVLTILTSKP